MNSNSAFDIFDEPQEKKYPDGHRPCFDFLFDCLEQPQEEEFKMDDVSETLSVDSALRNIREKLVL